MAKVTSIIREDARLLVVEMGETLKQLGGKTLLVAGASGFLCSYFLDAVAALNDSNTEAAPCRVLALDNFQSGLPDRIEHLQGRPDFNFIRHDVSQPFQPEESVDYIIHGASIASPTFYRQFPLETIDANVNGARNMLELATRGGAQSMVYISTSEIYGDPDPAFIPTAEDYRGFVSCTGPRACYDESKRLAETLCATYYSLHKTPIKVVRPFNVFGPGQRLDDKRIIPDLMSVALEQRPFVLYSDGRATRSLCYARDGVRAILYVLLSEADGEAFNIGNDMEEISMTGLTERMSEVAAPPRLPIEYRVSNDPQYLTDNPQRRCPDLTKLRTHTPYTPEVGLTEGLTRTLQSYRELL